MSPRGSVGTSIITFVCSYFIYLFILSNDLFIKAQVYHFFFFFFSFLSFLLLFSQGYLHFLPTPPSHPSQTIMFFIVGYLGGKMLDNIGQNMNISYCIKLMYQDQFVEIERVKSLNDCKTLCHSERTNSYKQEDSKIFHFLPLCVR